MEIETLRINLTPGGVGGGYDILVGQGLLEIVGERVRKLAPSRAVVIADEQVAALYGDRVKENLARAGLPAELVTFPAGEESKSLARVSRLYDRLFELQLDRQSCVVALGGGVTGDLAGFAAATFMRGIPLVQVPTSLLAQVDSSIGGKTGVNHPRGKNLIGAFHQPALVIIDVTTLQTLPRAELLSGLAEVVKHGVIRDAEYFAQVEDCAGQLLGLNLAALERIVSGSCRLKGGVVAADEREAALRGILNFGHTFGHAYETVSNYQLRHGEAVALGMISACHLAEKLFGLPPAVRARLALLLTRLGLPIEGAKLEANAVLAAMRGDKKARGGVLRFVVPERIGAARLAEVTDEAAVRAAVAAVM